MQRTRHGPTPDWSSLMSRFFILSFALLSLSTSASAQTLTNEAGSAPISTQRGLE